MRILIITETLLAGGAEWFSLRLSEALMKRGHEVKLFVLRPNLVDKRITRKYPNVPYVHLPSNLIRITSFLDRLINIFSDKPYCTRLLNSRSIWKTIKAFAPDVLHSHLIKADITTIKGNKSGVRHTTTIHGDYISILKENSNKLKKQAVFATRSIDSIVAISDEQIETLDSQIPHISSKIEKIYNGYILPDQLPTPTRKDTFNFGIIARGIPEKGWEPAIKAFTKLTAPDARLYLYGESSFLNLLRKKYPDNRIIFKGFTSSPIDAVAALDVGLLPSYYSSESLPTTIIEYLAVGKPIIATAAGEIPKMIEGTQGDKAGILINTLDPEQMVEPIYQAMNKLMIDEDLYSRLSGNCYKAFEKFSMDKCVDRYLAVYKKEHTSACVVS